ncbi:MAG TPA: tetratricopeptide repeat protein [Pyrinomonadaceae bacterium]
MSKSKISTAAVIAALVCCATAADAGAQSGATRPRRVNPSQPVATSPAPRASDEPAASAPATTRPATPAARTAAPASDTARAFALFQQKQFDAALAEARKATSADPKNSEGWKIAGFAEMELKRYADAATDLLRALELQRAEGAEDANTSDALATAYVRTEKYAEALPLLVAATTRKGTRPDAITFYYRGLSEFRTNKLAESERSFNEAVKLNPKDAASLYYLGRLAFDRKDNDAAVNLLNRATAANAQFAEAWTYLAHAYLRRGAASGEGPKADADYQGAVRASEALMRLRSDEPAVLLHGQALINSKQYARAATVLERAATGDAAKGETLYLLGFAYTQAKNHPKAVAALERAAAKTPEDANVYRFLGYNYQLLKQYAKALAAYERGMALAPDDAYFKEAADQVRPFAK